MAPFNSPPTNRPPRKKKNEPADVMENLPRLGLHPVAPGTCTTPLCGTVADEFLEDAVPTGWARTGVFGSSDPDRVWCSGLCATYGIALAEVRAIPAPQTQEVANA
ncbi:hypothetical protein ACN6LM_003873 [Streptomyces sp. SAS_281]|uniref:hypothetical protein n=1 Tax=Streptomyces sp. SAS_281 TaxID=3412744 RepID=UPI00403C1596